MTSDYRTPARSLVDELRVGRPCFESWARMRPVDGESPDRVRHCARCDKSVFDVSSMPRDEAEAFLIEKTGQPTCVRFFRRDDDTVVTSDCPITRAERRVVLRTIAATAVVTGAIAVLDECAAQTIEGPDSHGAVVTLAHAWRRVARGRETMGTMAIAPIAPRRTITDPDRDGARTSTEAQRPHHEAAHTREPDAPTSTDPTRAR